ncbi:TlpA family protein disulfide reductase [Ekhidna sp.]|uniref:TlpA family protein disulfide reductase n=1 Tax=Ekhidna sp. TaxID=2608089 RepID=UPI0035136FC6
MRYFKSAVLVLLFFACTPLKKEGSEEGTIESLETQSKIKLAKLEGESINLSALNEEILILNIWATWCKPCVAEMPSLVEMKNALPGNMKLLLASDEPTDRQLNFIAKKEYDLEFVQLKSSLSSLGVYVLPTTIIVKNGEIVDRLVGAREWNTPKQIEELKAYL